MESPHLNNTKSRDILQMSERLKWKIPSQFEFTLSFSQAAPAHSKGIPQVWRRVQDEAQRITPKHLGVRKIGIFREDDAHERLIRLSQLEPDHGQQCGARFQDIAQRSSLGHGSTNPLGGFMSEIKCCKISSDILSVLTDLAGEEIRFLGILNDCYVSASLDKARRYEVGIDVAQLATLVGASKTLDVCISMEGEK